MTTIPQPDIRPAPPGSAEAIPRRHAARRIALVAAAWLNIVGIGLWLGAMIGIGAIVAPVAFQLARDQAGLVLGESFRRLNYLGLGCAAVVVIATVLEALVARLTTASAARLALVVVAAGIAAYLGWRVFPEMEALRAAAQTAAFDQLHNHYEQLGHAQFLLLLGAALTIALRVPPRPGDDSPGTRPSMAGLKSGAP